MRIIHIRPDNNKHQDLNNLLNKSQVYAKIVMPGCHFCEELEPKWKKMENVLKRKYNNNVVLSSIHSDSVNNVNCNTSVDGYPTIRYFNNGNHVEDFQGERSVNNLVEWVKKHSGSNANNNNNNKSTRKRKRRRSSSSNSSKKGKIVKQKEREKGEGNY